MNEEAREQEANRGDFKLESQIYMIPHPSKVDKGGEDAFFETSDSKSIGVADGVGGWQMHGVDPSIYAKSLMNDCKFAYEELGMKTPLEMLSYAYENAKTINGSSTACIEVLSGNILQFAYLGDSGFLLVRNSKILYRFKEQLHSFNYPFQLGTASTNVPSDATRISIEVMEGDVIVTGTDGLFDNLYDQEIVEIVNMHTHSPPPHIKNQNMAEVIAKTAQMKSHSLHVTPFRSAAYDLGLIDTPNGGKLDDITVIVSTVTLANKRPEYSNY